jgi:alanine racemase
MPESDSDVRESQARLVIHIDNVLHNATQACRGLPGMSSLIAVVKDCAYGLGAGPISMALERAGASFFAVARTDEAEALRRAGLESPILVLGAVARESIDWASRHGVRLTINDSADLNLLQAAAPRRCVTVHLNVDTGMGRLGLRLDEIELAARELDRHRDRIRLEGAFTHFACADSPDSSSVDRQCASLREALARLRRRGLSPDIVHCANSAAAMRYPPFDNWRIRPGIALYGCSPDPEQHFSRDLRTVVTLKAPIAKIKTIGAGECVSYGATWSAARPTTIATVPIGYAHGYPRALSNRGEALIRGRRHPIVGRVTMDYIMVDISESSCAVGDEVVVIGRQGAETIRVDDIARQCNTIGYEILCGLSPRIDRVYVHTGSIVAEQKGFRY